MTESSPLSPAAQAVMKAAASAYWEEEYEVASPAVIAAAALRAVADQIAYGHHDSKGRSAIIDEDALLAIAAELAPSKTPSSD